MHVSTSYANEQSVPSGIAASLCNGALQRLCDDPEVKFSSKSAVLTCLQTMFFLQAVLLQAAVLSCKLQESLTLQGVQDAADAPPYPAAHSLQLSAERLPAAAVVVPTGQSAQGNPIANDPSEKEPSLPAEQKITAGDIGEQRSAVGGSSAGAAYNVLSQQHAMRTLLSVVCCLLSYDGRWACNKVSPCICIPGKTQRLLQRLAAACHSHCSTPFGPVPQPGACREQPAALIVPVAGVVVLAGHL